MSTWVIVGATRGIGLEFVRQLLERGDQVFATARNAMRASQLWSLAGAAPLGACRLLECDVTEDASISRFISDVVAIRDLQRIDYVVINAGILRYPNRATEMSFDDFSDHMKTNAIGPIILAQKLVKTGIPIGTIIFMSSDSGSATEFRAFEDGFAAYAASKAALNQALRHMAVELSRQRSSTSILAMHPGEVSTEVADVPLGREIDGIMSTEESVYGMLRVIGSKTIYDSGTFWTWEGKVYGAAEFLIQVFKTLMSDRSIPGSGFRSTMFRVKKSAQQRIGRVFDIEASHLNRFRREIPNLGYGPLR